MIMTNVIMIIMATIIMKIMIFTIPSLVITVSVTMVMYPLLNFPYHHVHLANNIKKGMQEEAKKRKKDTVTTAKVIQNIITI